MARSIQVAPIHAVFSSLIFFAVGLSLVSVPSAAGIAAEHISDSSAVSKSYGLLPLAFEVNHGQTGPDVKFIARGESYSLLIGKSEAVLSLRDSAVCRMPNSQLKVAVAKCLPGSERLRLQLADVGAKDSFPVRHGRAEAVGEILLPGRVNYLIGNDPAKWHTGVPVYQRVRLAQVYPGVDILYYGNQARLEYDFEVAPFADPRAIRMHFEGAGLKLDPKGNLEIALRDGKVIFERPVIYQEVNRRRRTVSGGFRLLDGSTMDFRLGRYDRSKPLIIDPVLSYSTYVGGSQIAALAVDSAGDAYVTGVGESIATTSGAFQLADDNVSGYGGNAFVTKLDPTGTTAIYSTYIGGSGAYPSDGGQPPAGAGDGGAGIAVDSAGNAYLAGFTYSPDFPLKNPLQGQNNAVSNGNDNAFVAELNATGSALVYSTYLGGSGCGNGEGDGATGLALDTTGAAYIVGNTCSPDFPTTMGAFQASSSSAFTYSNAFVAKISSGGTSLVYSTYLAGSSGAAGGGIAVDSSLNAYVTGSTYSTDFPVTSSAYQSTNRAGFGTNAFVTKLNPAGSAPIYSTYLGGTGGAYTNPIGYTTQVGDGGNAIVVDGPGNAYVTGTAGSTDFPVTSGAFQPNDGAALGVTNAFIAKLNATGSSLVYSTYLGGSGGTGHAQPRLGIGELGEFGSAISIDSFGNAYVAGIAGSSDFPVTAGAVQTVNHAAASGNTNAFFAELNPTGTGLLYATYLGGSGTETYTDVDYATGVAQNGVGNVYVAGIANSPDFPTTTGAYQVSGSGSSFISMLDLGTAGASELSIAPAILTILSPAVGQPSAAKTVTLANGGTDAVTIQSISIGETNAAEFTESNTCGSSLSAGDACTVSITFNPLVAGGQSASLSITDDAPGSPQSIPLTGNEIVYSPNASFSPSSLTFSLQAVGTISPPQTATLSNTGNGPLNIASITLGGPTSTGSGGSDADSYFAETNNCGSTLAAGASCIFQIAFTPPTSGQINDGVFVKDNQGNSPQVLQLTGTGAAPAMTLSSMSLTFASQQVGSTSGAQSVTLANTGQVPVTITSIFATGDFSETSNCGGMIAVSASCTISVTFMPTATGARTGTISINDNASGSPQAIALSGTGTAAPAVTLSNTSLAFSAQSVGSTSAAQTVQLTNSGQAPLSITSIAASGDFAVTSSCGSTLPVSSSCSISVTFSPTMAGSRTGKVAITDDASGSPQMIALTGIGTVPAVMLSTVALNFAAQVIGTTSAAQTVTLMNSGQASLSITGIAASGNFATQTTCGSMLAAGANCTISVTFTPTAAGNQEGQITIVDDASGSPQTVSLTGTGVTPVPVATLTPASLTFAAQPMGSESSVQAITLTNTGSAPLNIASIAASGDFAETNTCGASLVTAANCTISVTFTPTAAGARTGTIGVADNAAGSPQTVALSGTGTSVEVTTSSQVLTVSSPGGTASDTLTLTSQDGFSGMVSLACKVTYQGKGTVTDPPTCSISPSQGQIASNGSLSTILTVSTTAPSMTANSDPLRAAEIFSALLLIGFIPRRRWRKLFLTVLAIGILGVTCGCGGHSSNGGGTSSPGTPTGNYQVVVTTTSATVTAITTISLTVN